MSGYLAPGQRQIAVPAFLKLSGALEFGNLHLSNRSLEFIPVFNRHKEVIVPLQCVREMSLVQDVSNLDCIVQSLAIESDVDPEGEFYVLQSGSEQYCKRKSISADLLDIFTQSGDYADYFGQLLKSGQTLTVCCYDGASAQFISCDFYFHDLARQLVRFCTKTFDFSNVFFARARHELQADVIIFAPQPDVEEVLARTERDANGLFVRRAQVFEGAYRWCDFIRAGYGGAAKDSAKELTKDPAQPQHLQQQPALAQPEPQPQQPESESEPLPQQQQQKQPQDPQQQSRCDIVFKLKSPVGRELCGSDDVQLMRRGCQFSESKFNQAVLRLLKHMQYDSKDLSQSLPRIDSVPIFDQNYSEILDIPALQTLRRDLQLPGKLYVIYSSRQDGAFLPSLYSAFSQQYRDSIVGLIDTYYKKDRERVAQFANDNFVILIQTAGAQICGFSGNAFGLKQHSDYYNSSLFVFKDEKFTYYCPVAQYRFYAFADKNFYCVGQEKYALWLDKYLYEIYTDKCAEFENDYLFTGPVQGNGVRQRIEAIEVFRFV